MVKKRKGSMTLAEHDALLKAEGRYESFVAQRKEREKFSEARRTHFRELEMPVVQALKNVGVNVESVWDLVNTSVSYEKAISVLLEHIQRPYHDRIKGGIARALAVPEARSGWTILISEFRKEKRSPEKWARDGLAVALSEIATDAVIGELIELVRDRDYGTTRILLLRGLKKSKHADAKKALEELASDPDLEKEIASWKRKKR
jgi:hypothetical protein